jgi:hypothetical protein
MRRLVPFAVPLALIGCLEANAPGPVTGNWGGEHLGLIASLVGADLEYDCATGRIVEPIQPDPAGRFSVTGQHFPGHGGPFRIDEEKMERPARYDGTLRGGMMSLTVVLTDSNQVLGSFQLTHGGSPHVFRCL